MSLLSNTCYYCGAPKTSMEHVPPKVFFPNEKYSLNNKSQRTNLITVPSCDKHNSSKSHLDQYLFFVMTCNVLANEHGENLALKKAVDKVVMRNPKLFSSLIKSSKEVYIRKDNKELESTLSFDVDMDKLDECFEHLFRGLYYYHFHTIYTNTIRIVYEFTIFLDEDSLNMNQNLEEYRKTVKQSLVNIKKHGKNPEIFHYQIIKENSGKALMQLTFYDALKTDIFFKHP